MWVLWVLTHIDDAVEGVAAPLSGTAWIATIVDCYGVSTGAAAFVVLMKLLERSNGILVAYIMCPITPIDIIPAESMHCKGKILMIASSAPRKNDCSSLLFTHTNP